MHVIKNNDAVLIKSLKNQIKKEKIENKKEYMFLLSVRLLELTNTKDRIEKNRGL